MSADNYYPDATVDDGSCVYSDDSEDDDGIVYGCMDVSADNYNPNATHDDGNCAYIQYLEGDFVVAGEDTITLTSYNDSGLVSLITAGMNIHVEIGDEPIETSVTVSSVSGYDIIITEDIPESYIGETGLYDLEITSNTPPQNGQQEISGCTDSGAINYNPNATIDDGSCTYEQQNGQNGQQDILGCMDVSAKNYNPDATVDDGSCTYQQEEEQQQG